MERDLTRYALALGAEMRDIFPDRQRFVSQGTTPEGRLRVSKSGWPAGKLIEVPVVGDASRLPENATVIVEFEHGNRQRPFVRSTSPSGGGPYKRATVANFGLWPQGQGWPLLGGISSGRQSPWVPYVGGGSSYPVDGGTNVSTGVVIADLTGSAHAIWTRWIEYMGTYRLFIAAYPLGSASPTPLWGPQVALESESAPSVGYRLQYGGLIYVREDVANDKIWVLEGQDALAYDRSGALLGGSNTGFRLDQSIAVRDASAPGNHVVAKCWWTFRSTSFPNSRPQQDSYVRGFRLVDGEMAQAWEWSPLTARPTSGYEVASSLEDDGRPPSDVGRGVIHLRVSGWLVPDETTRDSVMQRGNDQFVFAGTFPKFPDLQTSVSIEGRSRSQFLSDVALKISDGTQLYRETKTFTISSRKYEGGHIAAFDSATAAFVKAPHSPSNVGFPYISYEYTSWANEDELVLGTSAVEEVLIGNLIFTTPKNDELPPSVTDNRYPAKLEIEGGWGYTDETLTTKAYCDSSRTSPDLSWYAEGHPLVLPYPGPYVLGNQEENSIGHALCEWPATTGSLSPLSFQGAILEAFRRGDAVGGCSILSPDGVLYSCYMRQDVFVLGTDVSVPQIGEPTLETELYENAAVTRVIEKYGYKWTLRMRPRLQHCCETILRRRAFGAGAVAVEADVSQRFILKWPTTPTGVTAGDCEHTRGTADNVWALIGFWPENKIGMVRSMRDHCYAQSEGGLEHLPYRAVQIRAATGAMSVVETLKMPHSLDTYVADGVRRRVWDEFFGDPRCVVKGSLDASGRSWALVIFQVRNNQTDTVYLRHWRVYWNGTAWEQAIYDVPSGSSTDPGDLHTAGSIALSGASGNVVWAHPNGLRAS